MIKKFGTWCCFRGATGPPRPRLAAVVDHPAQHFSPGFRLIEQDARLALRVFYWRADVSDSVDVGFDRRVHWDIDLQGGYSWVAVGGDGIRSVIKLARALTSYDPDVVLCFGWATLAARTAIIWGLLTGKHVFLYGDSTWQGSRRICLAAARGLLLRTLFKLVRGALSTGAFNREFYIRHGMHPSRIYRGVYPADVGHYRENADRHNSRDRLGVPDEAFVIGFAGKLIPRKGVSELLEAVALLPKSYPWQLLIVGDGPQRHDLEQLADELGVRGCVRFLGFCGQSAMPGLLSSCDVVVVPSVHDMRVLVCVEAMAAGAPVIVSSHTAVWGDGDLVEHGKTGLVYRSGDPSALANQLVALMMDRGILERLREAGSEVVCRYGPEAFRDAIIDAFVRDRFRSVS